MWLRLKWLSVLMFVAVVTSAQQINFEQFYNDVIKKELNQAAFKTAAFDAAPTGNYDIFYHKCNWKINPDTLMISGSVETHFTLTQNASSVFYDAADNLIIDSVWLNGINTGFERSTNAVEVFLNDEIITGEQLNTTVFYHGSPTSTGFGSFVKGTNVGGNVIWTLSEPYGASDWWPCKQTLNDKIDSIDVFVTSPELYKVGGPGLLIDAVTTGDNITWHWKSNYPIVTYLIGIVVSVYNVYEFYAPHHEDSVLFYNLIYPETLVDAISGINAIVPSFELFTDIYGNYPFEEEKYGHMQFGWGGGMEHQTMSSVTHFGYELLVHEMAHQWFGDKITCASWRDIWLNEGFATYSTWMSYDFSEDPNNYYEGWLNGTRNVVVSQPGGSVWVDDTTLVSRIFDGRLSYYKGGWLLHMLRKQLGDEDFFQGIKNYITDADLSYGFVTTNDLIQHLEAAADTSLTEFFDDWFYGQGFPTYHVLWTQDDNGFVTIALSQSTSHPSVDFFEMDVPLRIKGENDSLDIHLKHTQNGQLFSVPIPFEANAVILDPAIELLHGESIVTKTELLENTVQLVVYPTLVQDKINVQLFALTEDEYEIVIYSGSADLVMQSKFVADSQTAKFEIDVTTWPSGLYVIVVKNGSTDIVQKVIIL